MRSVFHVLPKFLDLNKIYSSMLSTKTINCVLFDISFLTQPRKCEQLIHLNIETKYFYGLRQPWGLSLLRSYRFNLLFSLWAPTPLTKFSFGTCLFSTRRQWSPVSRWVNEIAIIDGYRWLTVRTLVCWQHSIYDTVLVIHLSIMLD